MSDGSVEAVALKLMEHIATKEGNAKPPDEESRDYWLTLYAQCLRVAKGKKSAKIKSEPKVV